ncbi:MAG: hypothetical protein KGK17_10545 [Betaproteobacteria bacterium]|nr:hypothetical protein [Betaproteobacteria bacterium]
MLGDSERQDFYSSIKQHGFQENDFELTQQRDPTSGTGIYAITGTVTIRCKLNGKENTYRAGHGSSWPSQFHNDLAQGVFGNAST